MLYQLFHSTLDTERGDCATTFPLRLVLNIVVTHLLKKFSPRTKRSTSGKKRKGRGDDDEVNFENEIYSYKSHCFSKKGLQIYNSRIEDHIGAEYEAFVT